MSLTGVPLLVVTVSLTLAAAAVTIGRWRRTGRATPVIRVLGVLMTEALVTATVGLAVNRSQQFYPSWDALMNRTSTVGTVETYTPGHLDGWLQARSGGHDTLPITVPWHPPGWTTWGLTQAPTVVVPAGYLQHPSWRYPVVVILSDSHDGWTGTVLSSTAPPVGSPADPAVLVLARTTRPASVGTFGGSMAGEVTRDFRATRHNWAIVVSSADAGAAEELVRRQPGRYPALAVVAPAGPGRRTPSPAGGSRAGGWTVAGSTVGGSTVAMVQAGLPTGVSAVVISPGTPTRVAAASAGSLTAALAWAGRQLPAPMAAPAPLISPAPARRHGNHVGSSPPFSGERGSRGGVHGPGQHRR